MLSSSPSPTTLPFFLLSILITTLITRNIPFVESCTNVLVTPGASDDGNPMIAYNADSGALQGMLYHYPPTNYTNNNININNSNNNNNDPHDKNTTMMRKVWNWDTGVFLGEIQEVEITYNVVGNTNEYGLVIAETTFGGVEILSSQKKGKLDYGSLIYISLQRCKTAKEAIRTMAWLMDTYGYVSEGESFSIADRFGEVWIMEVIGRGQNKIGAVWVAMKIPDGMIAAHSNQARITAFPRNDTDNCLYSHDVISLAKEIGLYQSKPNDPHDLEFSFSDVYNPVTFMGARASDARTWSIFSIIAKDESFQQTFQDYALGKNLTNRMPLYIEPHSKLTFGNIMSVMSNHYEDTALQFDQDVGAGPYKSPYRARPLKWSYKGTSYHNERAVATQQTGWNFIAQIRMNKPAPISSILWFAVDDSSTSPRFPVYGCSRNVSFAYAGDGTQMGVPSPLLSFDLQKAFWVQNMVSNFVYTRWDDAFPFLQKKLASIHEHFKQEVEIIDKELMAVYDPNDFSWIINDATAFSVKAGDWMHREWMDFYGHIFARYRDFSVIEEDKEDPVCNCKVNENGFTDAWKEKVIQESGKHYQCLDDDNTPDQASVDHSTSEAVKVGESSLRGGQFSISGDAKSKN